MKRVVIFFNGNIVTELICEDIFSNDSSYSFNKNKEEIACFPLDYGYIVLDIILNPKYTPEP